MPNPPEPERVCLPVVDVSIVIPTFNAARFIRSCLESVQRAEIANSETIVVDSFSGDDTTKIAARYGRVLSIKSSATRARLYGAERARGRFVLNLDADQLLLPGAIERALATHSDAVVLGEQSTGTGLVARINSAEKRALHKRWKEELDPIRGGLMPRLYRKDLLIECLTSLPPSIMDTRPAPYAEDSLLYMLAAQRGARIAYIPDGLLHNEEASLGRYMVKWFQNGIAARQYAESTFEDLSRMRIRSKLDELNRPSTALAVLLRGVPFLIGYHFGR